MPARTVTFFDLPTLSGVSGTSSQATQGGSAIKLLSGAPTITDIDGGGYVSGAAVSIASTSGTTVSGDVLGILDNGGTFHSFSATPTSTTIDGQTFSFSFSNGLLTIANVPATSSNAPTPSANEHMAADYQTILSKVAYKDGSTTSGNRTATFEVNNGAIYNPVGSINTANSTVQVYVPPPVVGGGGTAVTFTENGNPVTVDSGITLADTSGEPIASATATISSGTLFTGDTLAFNNTSNATYGNIAGSYNNGVLTLTSAGNSATVAQFQAALDAVTFSTASDNPDNYGSDKTRSISFAATDADGNTSSPAATSTVNVTAGNDPPVLSGADPRTFTQGANGATGTAVAVDDSLAVTDPDNQTLTGATVTISSGTRQTGDELKVSGATSGTLNGIAFSYDPTTYTLTLGMPTGGAPATLAQYKSVLDSVTFDSTSLNPTNYGVDTSRTVSFQANDGSSANNFSNPLNATVAVQRTDQPPAVTASGGTVTFQATGASATPVVVDGGVAVSDPDDQTLASATIKLTNYKPGDVLGFTNDGTTEGKIAGSYDNAGTLTLTSSGNTATVAQFQAALDAVTFENTNANPDTTTRTVTFTANDGTHSTTAATTDMVAVQAAPVITNEASSPAAGSDLDASKAVTFTLTLSENVTVTDGGGGLPYLTLDTNPARTAAFVGASGATSNVLTFSYVVQPGDTDADVKATGFVLPANSTIRDSAGRDANLNSFTTIDTGVQIDTTAPGIAITTPIAGDNTVNKAEAAQGFAISGTATGAEAGQVVTVQLVNGAGAVADSYIATLTNGGAYSVQVTAAQAHALADGGYTVKADVSDKAGNPAPEATQAITVDETLATLGLESYATAGTDINAGKVVTFTLATNKPVSVTEGGAAPTLQLNDNEVATYSGQTGTPVSDLMFSYTVQNGDNVGNLQATAFNALPVGTTIQDAGGNPLDTSGFKPIDTGVQVDTAAPTLGMESSASPSGPDIGTGKTVTFTLEASEAVNATGSALTLNNGRTAAYATGSGTSALTYSYTVASGDDVGDLQATALTGAVIDNAGNAFDDSTFKVIDTKDQVDTVPPAVSSPSDTVAQNGAATAIGIAAPTDAGAGSLAIVAGALPSDGTVALANGTAVATRQALSVADLTGLTFTPTRGAYSQSSAFTYAVIDGAGNSSTGTATLAVGTPGNPSITGTAAGQTTRNEAPVRPFSGAVLSDPSTATDSLAITLTGGGGYLKDGPGQTGLTLTGAYSYSLAAGTPDAVTAELEALVFTPTAGAPSEPNTTRFTLSDASSAGTGASDASTTVTDTAVDADTVSIDSQVSYDHGVFTLSGHAASTAGVGSVEISALVNGVRQDLGAATMNPNGTFTFEDRVGAQQSFFIATLNDSAGGQAASQDPDFNLTGGLGPRRGAGKQESFGSSGQASTTLFRPNGTRQANIEAPGQTEDLNPYEIAFNHHQGGTTFVFSPGDGLSVVHGFKFGGADHDVLNLSRVDFGNSIANVLRNTGDIGGSAFITDPKTGDAIRLAGVTTAELKAHPKDFMFGP